MSIVVFSRWISSPMLPVVSSTNTASTLGLVSLDGSTGGGGSCTLDRAG